jgi:hypothetical protein
MRPHGALPSGVTGAPSAPAARARERVPTRTRQTAPRESDAARRKSDDGRESHSKTRKNLAEEERIPFAGSSACELHLRGGSFARATACCLDDAP